MRRFGVDTNGGVDLARAKAAGVTFAFRYVSDDGYAPQRNLTRPEADEWKAAGIALGTVWERSAADGGKGTRALDGWHAGRHDALTARMQQAEQGGPGNPIYFTVDFPALRRIAQWRVRRYFKGIRSQLAVRRIGVYGPGHICSMLLDEGLVTYAWQSIAWDGPLHLDPRTHIYQTHILVDDSFGSGQLDYDVALKSPDFGQWR